MWTVVIKCFPIFKTRWNKLDDNGILSFFTLIIDTEHVSQNIQKYICFVFFFSLITMHAPINNVLQEENWKKAIAQM